VFDATGGSRLGEHAVYPGTYDPVTPGHLDVIERVRHLFARITVLVAVNGDKQPASSQSERAIQLRRELPADWDNVSVTSWAGLTVGFCRQYGADVIIRGVRNGSDLRREYQLAAMNEALGITTLLLPANPGWRPCHRRFCAGSAPDSLARATLAPVGPAALSPTSSYRLRNCAFCCGPDGQRSELTGENDPVDWPVRFPAEMRSGTISVRSYDRADAAELFGSLADERVWEHMSRAVPADVAALDEVIRSRLADGYRATFTVRQGGRVAGITSVLFDPDDPAGAEVGGTLLAPGVWGTGVNTEVKRLLLAVIFRHGAQWVQLRTDERNRRSAAAIRKLGATDLGIRQEHLVRRDGTRRRSRIFRLDRPGTVDAGTMTGDPACLPDGQPA
jgi:pantetheine-phosphate adenylyltransferase